MTSDAHEDWWVVPTPRPQAKKRLICLPYAGGSATVFHRVSQGISPDVEVLNVQPPGRGFRLREPSFQDFARYLEALVEVVAPKLDRPYALLGHSMGALLAFELTRALRRTGQPLPQHLFVSAARAPRAWQAIQVSLDLPPAAFWAAVNELYGTPLDAPAHPDVLALAVPPLKADFAVIASYRYASEAPLAQPITAFVGARDPMVKREHAEGWAAETSASVQVHELPGPHLFLTESAAALSAHLNDALR